MATILDGYTPLADNVHRVELIETSTFTKQIVALLSDEEYSEFQLRLAANPQSGALIKGGGGYAKFEWPLSPKVNVAAHA